jgi:hypothetical protein
VIRTTGWSALCFVASVKCVWWFYESIYRDHLFTCLGVETPLLSLTVPSTIMVQITWLLAVGCFSSVSLAWPNWVRSEALSKRASLDICLENAKVPVYAFNTTSYTQAVKPFNIRLPFKPAAYAVPKTVADVQQAVKCGVQNKVLVTAKSGKCYMYELHTKPTLTSYLNLYRRA